MKKVLAAILALVMVLSVFTAGVLMSSALTSGDYSYTITASKATITAYNGTGGDIIIPDKLDGYEVTAIGDSAFSVKTTLTSVVIPNSVITIGTAAFTSCSGIVSLTLGSSVATIGVNAFYLSLIHI